MSARPVTQACTCVQGSGRDVAKRAIETWLADAPSYDSEISHAIMASRDALFLKYTDPSISAAVINQRAQDFAAWTVAATATGLQGYIRAFK